MNILSSMHMDSANKMEAKALFYKAKNLFFFLTMDENCCTLAGNSVFESSVMVVKLIKLSYCQQFKIYFEVQECLQLFIGKFK